jgi:hypothetical protein
MKKHNISFLAAILMILMAVQAPAQRQGAYSKPTYFYRNSLYFLLGYTQGPSFKKYVDWTNNYYFEQYNSTDSISDFSGNVDFSIGLRVRFSRHFASEFDFLTYSLRTTKKFFIPPASYVVQDLELNVAVMSASILILFDFSSSERSQLFVPFVATGISVFPIRLDHNQFRFTKTALAGNFGVGIDQRLSRQLSASLRADWTLGKTNMDVAHPFGEPSHFELDLATLQLQLGIMYNFD